MKQEISLLNRLIKTAIFMVLTSFYFTLVDQEIEIIDIQNSIYTHRFIIVILLIAITYFSLKFIKLNFIYVILLVILMKSLIVFDLFQTSDFANKISTSFLPIKYYGISFYTKDELNALQEANIETEKRYLIDGTTNTIKDVITKTQLPIDKYFNKQKGFRFAQTGVVYGYDPYVIFFSEKKFTKTEQANFITFSPCYYILETLFRSIPLFFILVLFNCTFFFSFQVRQFFWEYFQISSKDSFLSFCKPILRSDIEDSNQ